MAADLFAADSTGQPLAARMRPQVLADYIGQQHLLGDGQPLARVLAAGKLHSMIFWGPPGVGKTTLARLLANVIDVHFIALSAVFAGVKDIRQAMEEAKLVRAQAGRATLLFVDEVHRFNKAQQDAFLPFIEDGTVIFVGATTENPSFELNNAILSRSRVYVLKALTHDDIAEVIRRALNSDAELRERGVEIENDALAALAHTAEGDARTALNLLEMAADLASPKDGRLVIDQDCIAELLNSGVKRFDKGGDIFYEQISALHKAVRGSHPDAALYWCLRMLDGGCDPLYVARRVVRMASEDIGNADPRALQLALNAWDVIERLGSPEGELTLAQAVIYMACAPKSNAVYNAFNQMRALIANSPAYEVPEHIRNAPTKLLKELGFGQEYKYAHDYPDAYPDGENYLPEDLADLQLYQPVGRGLEGKIGEKLNYLRARDQQSSWQRYRRKSQ